MCNQKNIYVGAGAPGTAYEGQFWVDISTDPPVVKVYDLTNTAWMTMYPIYYESQAGGWAPPSQSPITNGTIVILYNSTEVATRIYVRSNGAWANLDTASSPTLTGDAVVGDVRDGKFFYKDDYTKLTGTLVVAEDVLDSAVGTTISAIRNTHSMATIAIGGGADLVLTSISPDFAAGALAVGFGFISGESSHSTSLKLQLIMDGVTVAESSYLTTTCQMHVIIETKVLSGVKTVLSRIHNYNGSSRDLFVYGESTTLYPPYGVAVGSVAI